MANKKKSTKNNPEVKPDNKDKNKTKEVPPKTSTAIRGW